MSSKDQCPLHLQGFTQINPNQIRQDELLNSALPNLCKQTGVSYIKRIFEIVHREVIITFYFNQR